MNTIVPPVHQTRYRLNPNYVAIIKKDIDKLFVVSFIKLVMEVTWLSLIAVVPKKEWEAKNLCGFQEAQRDNKERSLPIAFY